MDYSSDFRKCNSIFEIKKNFMNIRIIIKSWTLVQKLQDNLDNLADSVYENTKIILMKRKTMKFYIRGITNLIYH